jgi:hypothetical protein
VNCLAVRSRYSLKFILNISLQDQALDSSKTARDKEWSTFLNDIEDKKQKVDNAYKQKEIDIKERYTKLEDNLSSEANS